MSKDQYLDMMEQLGKEPIPEEIPRDESDFPEIVPKAIAIFNLLTDNIVADVGYTGKQMSGVLDLMNILDVDKHQRLLVLELISILDNKAKKKSREAMERARKK